MSRFLPTFGKYFTLVLAVIAVILPLSVILFASLKTQQEYATTGPLDPPSDWFNFSNYIEAIDKADMVAGFLNTTVILVISLAFTILIGSMAAYAVDRFNFRGRKLVMALFLVATLIPSVTSQVATFQIIGGLGLYNTMGALILLFAGTDIIAIYIFIQFMQSIPVSLDEAAKIDGANIWTIYWRIILPNLKPAIATVVIIKGIAIYNEFYLPWLYLKSEPMISTALFFFRGPYGSQWELIAAATIVVIIPTVIAFLFLQKWIYKGLVAGAVK
jgi:multiple sugar transport system permease protein